MGERMQARVTWDKGLAFVGETGSGHRLAIDGARQAGASPMELMLLGLGGCSSVDVVMILGRMRQPVTGCVCAIDAERAAEDPKVFTRIHLHYRVAGAGLDPAKVARAIALSAQKYCSASIMLGKTAALSHDFELAAPS